MSGAAQDGRAPAISYCRLCEAGCGVLVHRDAAGVATRVEPDREHVVTRGFFCTKGHALAELVRDPKRLVEPVRRAPDAAPGAFERTTWSEATEAVAGGLARIARESGPDAIAIYQGNPTAFSWAAAVSTAALARVLGTGRFHTASSIDCAERFLVADLCYGHPLLVTIPDVRASRYVLLLGANPAVSTWAQLTSIPRWHEVVANMRRAGGKLVVVDPRRTETAAGADEHLSLRPGSDLDLLLALVRVVVDEGLADARFLERHARGLDAALRATADYDVARAAERTGLDAETIRRVAGEFARAPASVAVGHSGLTMTPRGGLAEWALVLLNAVCGRVDAPGGLLLNPGLLDLVRHGDLLLDRHAPLPAGVRPPARRILDDLPCAGLARSIEEGHVRALVVVAGNPAVTFPNASRLRRALGKLDLLVALDPYVNETTRLAHWVLPPPSMLEREDCVLLNSPFLETPYAQWTDRVSTPPPGVRDEWQVCRDLARRLPRLPSREPGAPWRRRLRLATGRWLGRILLATPPRLALAAMLALSGQVSLRAIRRHPRGLLLPPLRPGALRKRLRTHDRRIDLAPAAILDLLASDDRLRDATDREHPLRLISRRRRGAMNSWLNHLPSARRVDPDPLVEMHPGDARDAGLRDGETVRVANARGGFEGILRLSERMARGVVSAPHSFPSLLRDATADRGHFNDLVDDEDVEPLTGMPRFNGTAVSVARAIDPVHSDRGGSTGRPRDLLSSSPPGRPPSVAQSTSDQEPT